jgi:hypothetical protein
MTTNPGLIIGRSGTLIAHGRDGRIGFARRVSDGIIVGAGPYELANSSNAAFTLRSGASVGVGSTSRVRYYFGIRSPLNVQTNITLFYLTSSNRVRATTGADGITALSLRWGASADDSITLDEPLGIGDHWIDILGGTGSDPRIIVDGGAPVAITPSSSAGLSTIVQAYIGGASTASSADLKGITFHALQISRGGTRQLDLVPVPPTAGSAFTISDLVSGTKYESVTTGPRLVVRAQ